MKINGVEVKSELKQFVFDGDHKFYVLDNYDDLKDARAYGYTHYDTYSLLQLEYMYEECECDLKFIHPWNVKANYDYAPQFCAQITFEY